MPNAYLILLFMKNVSYLFTNASKTHQTTRSWLNSKWRLWKTKYNSLNSIWNAVIRYLHWPSIDILVTHLFREIDEVICLINKKELQSTSSVIEISQVKFSELVQSYFKIPRRAVHIRYAVSVGRCETYRCRRDVDSPGDGLHEGDQLTVERARHNFANILTRWREPKMM